MDGYLLEFDRAKKCYVTRNKKYTIRPPLSKAMKEKVLSDSDLAIISFVLETDNVTM